MVRAGWSNIGVLDQIRFTIYSMITSPFRSRHFQYVIKQTACPEYHVAYRIYDLAFRIKHIANYSELQIAFSILHLAVRFMIEIPFHSTCLQGCYWDLSCQPGRGSALSRQPVSSPTPLPAMMRLRLLLSTRQVAHPFMRMRRGCDGTLFIHSYH